MNRLLFIVFIFFTFTNQVNANVFADESEEIIEQKNQDPFESWNRKIFNFNLSVDKYTLRPVARTYRKITPRPARTGIKNILNNLYQPWNMINSLAQGKIKNTGRSLASFAINSTIGILGIFTPSESFFGITKPSKEDFAQTLAKYKVPQGPYLILPFLGPSTPRSLTGRSVRIYADPVWNNDSLDQYQLTYSIANIITVRESLLELTDDLENSLDPYSVVKSAYLQNRKNLIKE
jgi:phospholipid-binding lipoprotein MlaA